ncbi:MAG: TetR/AcrR family transcriptional regulator, partial [Aeromicrobium sp.]
MTAEILEPRRRPTQERSQRKFDQLLQVSRELLIEVGFESFTCEEVAHRAGLPIGTLYQFFQNKYVIVCELDRQDAIAVKAELAAFAKELPSLDWLRFLARLVDHMAI